MNLSLSSPTRRKPGGRHQCGVQKGEKYCLTELGSEINGSAAEIRQKTNTIEPTNWQVWNVFMEQSRHTRLYCWWTTFISEVAIKTWLCNCFLVLLTRATHFRRPDWLFIYIFDSGDSDFFLVTQIHTYIFGVFFRLRWNLNSGVSGTFPSESVERSRKVKATVGTSLTFSADKVCTPLTWKKILKIPH